MSARKLGLSALIYGLGGMLNRIIGFLLLPLFTKILTEEDYGAAGMLNIVSTFLVAAFSVGVTGSLSSCYYKAETPEAKRRALASALVLLTGSCVVMLAVVLPFASTLAEALLGGRGGTELVVLSMLTNALMIIVQPLILSIQYEERSRLFVTLSAVSTVISAVCNIIAVAWLHMGLRGWIASQLIGQAIGLGLYAVPFLKGGWPGMDFPVLRRLLVLGLPMMPCFFFMYIIQQGNRIAVEYFQGFRALGIYTVMIGLASVSSLAVTAFQNSWTPYFMTFREKPREAGAAFGRVTTYYFYFMGLAVVCFFAFAQPVVTMMTDAKFHSGWVAVGPLALANVLSGAVSLLMPAQYFSEKLGHLTGMQGVAAAISVGINALMISQGGLAAAGLGLALSYGALLIIHGWWNHRGLSMQLGVRYEWGRLATLAAAIGVIAMLYLLFPAGGIVSGFLLGAVGPLTFCAIVWLLLRPDQRCLLRRTIRRVIPARRAPAS